MRTSSASEILRAVLAACLVIALVAGCKSQFRVAIETIAVNVGRNADDVERAFVRALPNAPESELTAVAQRSASRTGWIRSLGRSLAAEWEEQATLRSIPGATCDLLDLARDLGDAMTIEDVARTIRHHIQVQGLAESDQKVAEIADGIIDQLDVLSECGSANMAEVGIDLACLPF